jgi:hypothetical protein
LVANAVWFTARLPSRRQDAQALHRYSPSGEYDVVGYAALPVCGGRCWRTLASADRFRAAVQEAKIGPDKDIPHVTPEVIVKYITDLRVLGLL